MVDAITDVRAAARVQQHVDGWSEPPDVVVLFGSAARGEMRTDSDIDLFVVGDGVMGGTTSCVISNGPCDGGPGTTRGC